MKTISLKFILLVVGISFLSGCYTQLSEPVSREEYYTEPDTVYQYQEPEFSDYNLGYRDGYRDFLNDYLWYGYNPDSYFYFNHRPYWNSPWSYYHSFYLGIYDPYFYDPFYDWGYFGYYSPYSYYSYSSWYYSPYSRHYYGYGYYYRRPYYYYGGYTGTKKVSAGREQLTANRQSTSGAASAGQASRVPISSSSDFQNTLNLPMTAGGGSSSAVTGSSRPSTQSLPEGIIKPNKKESQSLNSRPKKTPEEPIPGFQTKLTPPASPEIKPIKKYPPSRSTKPAVKKPVKKSSTTTKAVKPTKSSSSSSETKTISKPKARPSSSSGKSSRSSYSAPSKTRSSNSSSSRSSTVRSSSGSRSSGSSSSRSSSSKSSSSKSSSSKRSSSKSR